MIVTKDCYSPKYGNNYWIPDFAFCQASKRAFAFR